jgi:hypothetical protein
VAFEGNQKGGWNQKEVCPVRVQFREGSLKNQMPGKALTKFVGYQ